MFLPATLASLVRLPCPTHGWGKGVKIEMDHANAKMKLTDEDGNYPLVELPVSLVPSLYLGTSGYGWTKTGSSLICLINYKKVIEITATAIIYYNSNENPMTYHDLTTGNIYTMGNFFADGIDFPI